MGDQLAAPALECRQGQQDGTVDVPQLADTRFGAAHVEDEGRGVLGQQRVSLVQGQPPWAAPVADEHGEEGHRRQQGQSQEPLLHQGGPTAESFPPDIAEIRIRQGSRRHGHHGRDRKGADREAGEAQGIVEFIPLSFWYDAPLIARDSDRRHDP